MEKHFVRLRRVLQILAILMCLLGLLRRHRRPPNQVFDFRRFLRHFLDLVILKERFLRQLYSYLFLPQSRLQSHLVLR